MNSPALIPFKSIIHLDKKSKTPIYLQLAQQFINLIQRGILLPGTKLLGTRKLSEVLEVHRQTIIATYEELELQGWLKSVPNKGTFVIEDLNEMKVNKPLIKIENLDHYPNNTGYKFKQSSIIDNPYQHNNCILNFTDGTPDIRLSAINDLGNMYSASIKRKQTQQKMAHHNHDERIYFKKQLCNYLNLTRGLRINTNNLLITRSTEMSLYLISQLILESNHLVLVAELGFFTANMIFQNAGAKIKTIPVDEEGICVEYIKEHFKPNEIRMIYITPHYHYPTTVTLSVNRRLELMKLASEYHFVIIEDDYDFEFEYESSAILPLASSDVNGMVIYIGTFGKSLAPGFRTGFIVAPENLLFELKKYLGIIDRQGDVVMEQVLGEMIDEGTIFRHLKKSLKTYKNRRDLFCNLLEEHFNNDVIYKKPNGGLAVWMNFNKNISLLKLSDNCKKDGLFIPQTLLYQNKQHCAIRIGFGHLNEQEIEQSITILNENYHKL